VRDAVESEGAPTILESEPDPELEPTSLEADANPTILESKSEADPEREPTVLESEAETDRLCKHSRVCASNCKLASPAYLPEFCEDDQE
jgi:hypothetical protein